MDGWMDGWMERREFLWTWCAYVRTYNFVIIAVVVLSDGMMETLEAEGEEG